MSERQRWARRLWLAGVLLLAVGPTAAIAGDTWGNFAELRDVREETVMLGADVYRAARGMVIVDHNGVPLDWDALSSRVGEMVVFSAKSGYPTPWVTRIALQKPDAD